MDDKRTMFFESKNVLTGKDRLSLMFSLNEIGSLSPELLSVYQATFVSTFIGATYGGLMSMKNISSEVSNSKSPKQTIVFKPDVVKEKLSPESIPLKFGKGAFWWGWRVGLLGGSYVFITSTISVYRGKTGILEYVIAGGLLGSMCQVKQGVKASAFGGLIGTIIGAVGGCMAYGFTVYKGETVEEKLFWQYGWKETQLRHSKETIKKLRDEEERKVKLEMELAQRKEDKTEAEFVTDETERQALVWR